MPTSRQPGKPKIAPARKGKVKLYRQKLATPLVLLHHSHPTPSLALRGACALLRYTKKGTHTDARTLNKLTFVKVARAKAGKKTPSLSLEQFK